MGRQNLCMVALVMIMIGYVSNEEAAAQPSTQFGVGLSFVSADGTGTGLAVNASRDLTSGTLGIGPVGDFSLHQASGATWTAFSGGIRVTGHPEGGRIMPFGQFLAGASVISGFGDSLTGFTLIYGGGIHMALTERVNVLFQFDLVTANLNDVDFDLPIGKRMTFGVSVPLGIR